MQMNALEWIMSGIAYKIFFLINNYNYKYLFFLK